MKQPRTIGAEPSSQVYQEICEAVLKNQYWYSDEPGLLKETFDAKNTRFRAALMIDILRRAAQRQPYRRLSGQYWVLADKLWACQFRRCGSSACLECLRAFQQAKAMAHRKLLTDLCLRYSKALLSFVTIIPLELNYPCGTLDEFDAADFNAQLYQTLNWGGINRLFLGSIDFDLKSNRFGKYWQPHWHLTLLTQDPELLRERLKDLFPTMAKHDYPVDVAEIRDFDVVPYIHKIIKAKELLREGRRNLPELLLALDKINPLDFLAMRELLLTAHKDGMVFY